MVTPRFQRPECGTTAGNRGIKPLPLPAPPGTPAARRALSSGRKSKFVSGFCPTSGLSPPESTSPCGLRRSRGGVPFRHTTHREPAERPLPPLAARFLGLTEAAEAALYPGLSDASVAQLVEHHLAKVDVEGSNPFARSTLPAEPEFDRHEGGSTTAGKPPTLGNRASPAFDFGGLRNAGRRAAFPILFPHPGDDPLGKYRVPGSKITCQGNRKRPGLNLLVNGHAEQKAMVFAGSFRRSWQGPARVLPHRPSGWRVGEKEGNRPFGSPHS